jgi:hypothetical protein
LRRVLAVAVVGVAEGHVKGAWVGIAAAMSGMALVMGLRTRRGGGVVERHVASADVTQTAGAPMVGPRRALLPRVGR